MSPILSLIAIAFCLFALGYRLYSRFIGRVFDEDNAWFTALPAFFMLLTTVTALISLLLNNYLPAASPQHSLTLVVTDIALLALSLGTLYLFIRSILKIASERVPVAVSATE